MEKALLEDLKMFPTTEYFIEEASKLGYKPFLAREDGVEPKQLPNSQTPPAAIPGDWVEIRGSLGRWRVLIIQFMPDYVRCYIRGQNVTNAMVRLGGYYWWNDFYFLEEYDLADPDGLDKMLAAVQEHVNIPWRTICWVIASLAAFAILWFEFFAHLFGLA